ncbi:MAG: DcaP family trimeric outer membrane transporter, partial [Myxococcota bacterium]
APEPPAPAQPVAEPEPPPPPPVAPEPAPAPSAAKEAIKEALKEIIEEEAEDGEPAVRFIWGGYVKFDAVFNSTGRLNGDSEFVGAADLGDFFLVPSLVPIGERSDGDGGGLNLNARETRFWLKTEVATPYGPLTTYIEADFYGFNASLGDERLTNGSTLRLRHAFGQLGPLMAGQFWSTFMDLKALPEKIDFGSPAGRIFTRAAMIRYTHKMGNGTLDVSLENPETTLTADIGSRVTRDDDLVPDVVVRYSYDTDKMHLAVGALGRLIRADEAAAPDLSDSQLGLAGRLSGKITTFGKDNWRFAFIAGQGLGRYITLNAYNAGYIGDDGGIELIPVIGGHTSYQRWWTDTIRSNLILSYSAAFNEEDRVETVNKNLTTVHFNTAWNPVPRTRFALELIYARRELESGDSGELLRAQGSVRYTF